MTRVAIIGNAGSGKSTLARRLGALRGLPVVHLDRLYWRPGWARAPAAEFDAAHAQALAADRWIIDGVGPWASVAARVAAADTVVFTDYALWRCYWWAARRQAASLLRPRPDLPPDCPMGPMTIRLARLIWRLHRELRPRLRSLLEAAARDGKRVVHLRRPGDMRRFLADTGAGT